MLIKIYQKIFSQGVYKKICLRQENEYQKKKIEKKIFILQKNYF